MSASRTPRTLTLIIFGILIVGLLNYQTLADRLALATYTPSADVSAYLAQVVLTERAKAMLYRSNPEIDNKAEFNRHCQTHVDELELGCYYHNHIYVLRITNPDLAPEMDAVMSHELLHAVWDRLSSNEQQQLGEQLRAAYAGITDDDLRSRMASYAKTEPGQQNNELHSILGSEQAALTPSLEAHYAKYFANRQQVVARHTAFKTVFAGRRAQLETELAAIRRLKSQLTTINASMENFKAAGNIPAYNALVPRQNQLVRDINSRIETYHVAVEEYNGLSAALDSQQIQPGE